MSARPKQCDIFFYFYKTDQVKTKAIPPTYLNALLIIQIVVHYIMPLQQIINVPYRYLGILLIAISITLNVNSVRYMERQKTTSHFLGTAEKLIVTGPFQRSRNPIYLSGVLLSFGIAIFLGSLSTFGFPILIFLILNSFYIPNEELRLEQLFGKEYLDYKQRVRRWV